MSSDRNIFAEEGETVDKVIFRPLSLDLNQKVKKVSDPPPRPLPPRLDNRPDEGWTPEVSSFNGAEVVESVQRVGSILKYFLFVTVSLSALAGMGWLIFWLIDQYNL